MQNSTAMKVTRCNIATSQGNIQVKVVESTFLVILLRIIGSLGIFYPLTVGTNSITLYPFIFVKNRLFFYEVLGRIEYTQLARHEFTHIVQQVELGLIVFLYLYSKYTIQYGYWDNPFEREARAHEGEVWYLMKRVKNAWKNYFKPKQI